MYQSVGPSNTNDDGYDVTDQMLNIEHDDDVDYIEHTLTMPVEEQNMSRMAV